MRALDPLVATLQHETFRYFLHEPDAASGLVPDCTVPGAPISIAVVGLALTAYPVGVERGLMTRDEAAARTLVTLRFFRNARQGREADATGYRGFYYHFLERGSGRRTWDSELSTMDTALFLGGVLTAAAYFDGEDGPEKEIRAVADFLYRRVDFTWALDRGDTLRHGWTPEKGFLPFRWTGYSEALLLYVLGLGSPTHPLPKKSYAAFTKTYEWRRIYGEEQLYAAPLFIHQFPQIWLDLRGVKDAFMRRKGIDYFENSRRAAFTQQRYAIRNPKGWKGYGRYCWGFTASEGPGPGFVRIAGKTRKIHDYVARGAPGGLDDGTVAPWGVAASIPFAPEIVVPTLSHLEKRYPRVRNAYGFLASLNPSVKEKGRHGWVANKYLGLNEGPIVLMIENYRSGLIWNLMRKCPYVVKGLKRAGFEGGWLAGR